MHSFEAYIYLKIMEMKGTAEKRSWVTWYVRIFLSRWSKHPNPAIKTIVPFARNSLVMELKTRSNTVSTSFFMDCCIYKTEKVLLLMCPNESLVTWLLLEKNLYERQKLIWLTYNKSNSEIKPSGEEKSIKMVKNSHHVI